VWRAPDGTWWRKGTLATAGLWAASIACRAALVAAANLTGAHLGDAGGVIALIFGVSLGAQYLATALRTDLLADLAAPAAE
jgi:hypothetical protein